MPRRERSSEEADERRQRFAAERSNAVESNTIDSTNDPPFRELRCFCGCSTLSHDEIEHFATMRVSSLITHATGKTLFMNFLKIGYRTGKSEAMAHLECHDLCDKILKNIRLIRNDDLVEDLLGMCPSFTWEEKINDAIQNYGTDHGHEIRQVLNDLKRECIFSIECHNDYERFRRELMRKIGK